MYIDWSGKYSIYEYHNKVKEYYPLRNIVNSQINFYKWWKNSNNNYIIRKNKDYPFLELREENKTNIIASDNEACASFYQFMYDKPISIKSDLYSFFRENQLEVGFPSARKGNLEAQKASVNKLGFKGRRLQGGVRGDFDLKLSHYLDAGQNFGLNTTIKTKCAIYLSPLNIFLTPKRQKGRKGYKNVNSSFNDDVGEDPYLKDVFHSLLINDVFKLNNGREAYKNYCEMCDLDFDNQLKIIEDSKKNSFTTYINIEKSSEAELDNVHTRFKVTESNYQFLKRNNDKDLIIEVNPKKGKHPRGTYEIPNTDALRFIDSKRSSFNWEKNKNFHQDAVPVDLRKFFTYK